MRLAGGYFIPIALILGLQAAAPHFISVQERDFPSPQFNRVPQTLGAWQARDDQTLDKNVTDYLRPDEYVLRDYTQASTGTVVNLFLAYFKTMQNTWGPHSPAMCLPGAGWQLRSGQQGSITIPGSAQTIPTNEFLMEKSGEHILVIYWYQNNRRIWNEEYLPKLRLLADLVQYRRSDVSLVRMITPMHGAIMQDERDRCLDFIRASFPALEARFAATD